jgi:threonine dehydratase
MIPLAEIEQAAARIAPHLRPTPLTHDPTLDLWIRWENQQVTGSFKPRGALNALLDLPPSERARGIVACSAGNHGQGIALAARAVGAPATVYAAALASPLKIARMRELGAEVVLVPGDYAAAETAGRAAAAASGRRFVSPYNDRRVMAGAGTLGIEIRRSLVPRTVLVPAGGGGLLAGVGSALRQLDPSIRIIGVQSEASAYLHAEFHGGDMQHVIELPSIADGLAGAVEPESETVPILQQVTDDFVLVSEEEIGLAIAYAHARHGQVLEGAGAVALAAVLAGRLALERPALALATGGNIDPERLAAILAAARGGA